jgi:hypothetical protein
MQQRTKQQRSLRSARTFTPRSDMVLQHPPQYQAVPNFIQKFRFQASAAVTNVTITTADLMSLLVMANTTTTTTALISAFRLKKVYLWASPAADLVPVTASVEFANILANSGFGQKRYVHSDSSVGATRVASVKATPPLGTPAASYQNVTSATQTTNGCDIILNGPSGMIVDIVIDMVLQNGEAPFTGPAITGGTAGTIYWNTLDGTAAGILKALNGFPIV